MEGINEQEIQANQWVKFGLRLAVSAALHPFEYSKVLIQLGYEPIAPRPGKSIFGKDIYVLPNIFRYTSYIKRVDGFSGCYRGLTPKLVGTVVGSICSERIADKLGVTDDKLRQESEELSDEEQFDKFLQTLKRDVVVHASGIIVTHPFHVISLRMMATFIGRETTYRSLIGSIVEVYKNDGIFGFFNGIIPKLLCDLACLVLTSTTVYLFNKHFIQDQDGRQYFASFTQFVYASLLYPLNVVSTCTAVSGSGLAAGRPPIMPEYISWKDCYNDLKTRGELKRGNSLFWRSLPRHSPNAMKISVMKDSSVPLPSITKYA
ncbi:mitochondrial carrier homolog 2 [Condylostylus longicornis]|uniref:mitochondrial carrier homolog 2 n=1 Tax=Condylostylus longicornis TaxID=2530218 RepID=UPI00244DF883|nr:mitochondrial carrier homolog 2 [Condylostylus longicornis]